MMITKQKSFDKDNKKGQLYLVPTPIGNLQDMTFRAIDLLKEVSIIASEDTRNTQKLLNHFQIETSQISFHEHNYKERIPRLVERLLMGENVAQVSDAGMPSISDPGHELVVACLQENISVIALPGATAGVTALIASGLPAERFTFHGFLSRKKSLQIKELEELKHQPETLIFYESPYRLKATFANMVTVFGGNRLASLCRELTKIHEEYLRGSLGDILIYLEDNDIKGECCILVSGFEGETIDIQENDWNSLSVLDHVELEKNQKDLTSKEAIKLVAKLRGVKKQEVYKKYHQDG